MTTTLYRNRFLLSEIIFIFSLSLWELQVIRGTLSVRGIPENSLNRLLLLYILKTSHRRCFVKNALKNLASFTGKSLCWSIFLINLQAYGPEGFLKRNTNTYISPVKFAQFLRAPSLKTIFQPLLPYQTCIMELFRENS